MQETTETREVARAFAAERAPGVLRELREEHAYEPDAGYVVEILAQAYHDCEGYEDIAEEVASELLENEAVAPG